MKKLLLCFVCFLWLIPETTKAQHMVKPGESLWKISQQYNMNYKDLLLLNPHVSDPSKIYPSMMINIRSKDKAQDIVDYARSLQDQTQYIYGADYKLSPYKADCSSWTKHIYEKFGIALPRVSWEQAKMGKPVTFNELQKGDLMFFGENGKISHVGIYTGDGYWISNLNSQKDVVILSKWGSWSYQRFLYGTRVL